METWTKTCGPIPDVLIFIGFEAAARFGKICGSPQRHDTPPPRFEEALSLAQQAVGLYQAGGEWRGLGFEGAASFG